MTKVFGYRNAAAMNRHSAPPFAAIAFGLFSLGLLWLVAVDGHAEQSLLPGANAGKPGKPTARRLPQSRDGLDMVGKAAPEWGNLVWLNSPPLRLRDLRGHEVLIPFWTN